MTSVTRFGMACQLAVKVSNHQVLLLSGNRYGFGAV